MADNGLVLDKVEGLMTSAGTNVTIASDDEDVDDSSGETQFIHLDPIFNYERKRYR